MGVPRQAGHLDRDVRPHRDVGLLQQFPRRDVDRVLPQDGRLCSAVWPRRLTPRYVRKECSDGYSAAQDAC